MWRNYTPLICMLLLCTSLAYSQNNYNNHWFFGRGHNVNFDNNTIQNGGIPVSNNNTTYWTHGSQQTTQIAVSDPNDGSLLFFYQTPQISISISTNTYRPLFFDKNGNAMPNGYWNILHSDIDCGKPITVPNPANKQQYYVFINLDGKLYYNIIDLSLNNGWGDVVPNKKMIALTNAGDLISTKMTITKGCDALWLMARSSSFNGFVSFKIDHNGVHNTPVYSYTGSLSMQDYIHSQQYATITVSNDHKLLAVPTAKGLELYDIVLCTGEIRNPRIIDTTRSLGAGFSPDNKLLYTTRAEYQTGYFESSELVQWDISQPQDLQRIRNSEQVLLINSAFYWPWWFGTASSYMGDIAQGKDGKLYVLSNTVYDDSTHQIPTPMPPTTTTPWAQTMHIIHQPNTPGMACNPERDGYKLDGYYKTGPATTYPILYI